MKCLEMVETRSIKGKAKLSTKDLLTKTRSIWILSTLNTQNKTRYPLLFTLDSKNFKIYTRIIYSPHFIPLIPTFHCSSLSLSSSTSLNAIEQEVHIYFSLRSSSLHQSPKFTLLLYLREFSSTVKLAFLLVVTGQRAKGGHLPKAFTSDDEVLRKNFSPCAPSQTRQSQPDEKTAACRKKSLLRTKRKERRSEVTYCFLEQLRFLAQLFLRKTC